MAVLLATSGAFLLGYLTRRWHRPVGFRPPEPFATRVSIAGGQPYQTFSVTSQQPIPTAEIERIVRAMKDGPPITALVTTPALHEPL